MKKTYWVLVLILVTISISCTNAGKPANGTVIVISTEMGDIRLRLYDETPQHRDNIIRLVRENFYDSLLFHRVIQNFMIQGGDPESRRAEPGARLGSGGPGYTVPAEIREGLYHKKGALAAARMGDQVNPEKNSSGSQFYIVQGKVWRPGELDTMEIQRNSGLQQAIFRKHFDAAQAELNQFRQNNDSIGFSIRVAGLREEADSIFQASPKFTLTPEQRELYTTIGGYPSLDGGYTVFGEVIEGLEVIDRIAAVQTDPANRPLKDVRMSIRIEE